MTSTSQDQSPQPPETTGDSPSAGPAVAPHAQVLRYTPVVAPSPDDVAEMIADEVRFSAAPEVREAAIRLLEAGYTVREAARHLDIRTTTVWRWSQSPDLRAALDAGRNRRRVVLAQRMESAATTAIRALVDVLEDTTTPAKDRIHAAEVVLDRCGISPETPVAANPAGMVVDIDFDERLARIVTGSQPQAAPDRPGALNPPGLTFITEESPCTSPESS